MLDRAEMEIQYFKSLVDIYVPNSTRVIYMPAYSEFEKTRNNTKWSSRRYQGMLGAEKVNELNKVLYKILEPDLLQPNGRILSFLDLFEASLPHSAWCVDGVHMTHEWYDNVMAMFWETYCNSVLLDEF
jgi:hypothetical protein